MKGVEEENEGMEEENEGDWWKKMKWVGEENEGEGGRKLMPEMLHFST